MELAPPVTLPYIILHPTPVHVPQDDFILFWPNSFSILQD